MPEELVQKKFKKTSWLQIEELAGILSQQRNHKVTPQETVSEAIKHYKDYLTLPSQEDIQ